MKHLDGRRDACTSYNNTKPLPLIGLIRDLGEGTFDFYLIAYLQLVEVAADVTLGIPNMGCIRGGSTITITTEREVTGVERESARGSSHCKASDGSPCPCY